MTMESMALQSDCYSLDEFGHRNRIGLSTVYAEIKAGRLVARKIGRRTVIMADDAKAWRDRLPKVQPLTANVAG
jgi:hypothetical protein